MVKVNRIKGFTLVEMLISMVILSSVIVIATQAYKQFIVNADKFSNKYQFELKETQKRELIFERIEQTVLYIANKRNLFGDSTLSIYWQGYPEHLLSVTKMSLQDPELSSVFKIVKKEDELIYCEKIIQGWLPQIGKEPDGLCEYSFVILTGVKSVEFSYFGWKDAFEKMAGKSPEFFSDHKYKKTWVNRYDASKAHLIPEWIAIDIKLKDDTEEKWMFSIKNQDPLRSRLLSSKDAV